MPTPSAMMPALPFALPKSVPPHWLAAFRAVYLSVAWWGAVVALLVAQAPFNSPLVLTLAGCGLLSLIGLLTVSESVRSRLFLWSLLALAAVGTLARTTLSAEASGLAVDLIGILVVAGVVLGDLRATEAGTRTMLALAAGLVALAVVTADSRVLALQAGLWASTLMLVVALVMRLQRRTAANTHALFDATRQAAITDPLSGLMNRRGWEEHATRAYAQALRERRPLTVAMIDADHFKAINDRYGHAAGDAAIQWLAEHVRMLTRRPLDLSSRFGGEEFAVLWYDCGADEGQHLASQLREQIALRPMPFGHFNIPVTVSIGLCQLTPDAGQSLTLALASADAALYAAKASGRNRVASKCYLPREMPAASVSAKV